jgi:hypothetical protein
MVCLVTLEPCKRFLGEFHNNRFYMQLNILHRVATRVQYDTPPEVSKSSYASVWLCMCLHDVGCVSPFATLVGAEIF